MSMKYTVFFTVSSVACDANFSSDSDRHKMNQSITYTHVHTSKNIADEDHRFNIGGSNVVVVLRCSL